MNRVSFGQAMRRCRGQTVKVDQPVNLVIRPCRHDGLPHARTEDRRPTPRRGNGAHDLTAFRLRDGDHVPGLDHTKVRCLSRCIAQPAQMRHRRGQQGPRRAPGRADPMRRLPHMPAPPRIGPGKPALFQSHQQPVRGRRSEPCQTRQIRQSRPFGVLGNQLKQRQRTINGLNSSGHGIPFTLFHDTEKFTIRHANAAAKA